MRKHISKCSEAEVQAIAGRVHALAASRAFIEHAAERMHHKKVSAREIEIALRYGQPIEVHTESGEWRALIMHTFGKPKVKVNVVINLENGTVITTWKNNATDNHSTLDESLYGWQVNLVEAMAGLGGTQCQSS